MIGGLRGNAGHEVRKLSEQVVGVVRTGRCFRVILDGKRRRVGERDPGTGLVVEVHMRDPGIRGEARRVYGKAVVLRGDLDSAGVQILDRMIGTPMPEGQLIRSRTDGKCRI